MSPMIVNTKLNEENIGDLDQKLINEKNKLIKLREYVPIIDNICINSMDQDQVYAIKFQGKPVNKIPLKNSNIEIIEY